MERKMCGVLLLMCMILCVGATVGANLAKANAASEAGLSSAECMITIETNSRRVLYGHNYHKRRPMASVTKILTAITVIENCADLNAKISVPAVAEGVEGSSIYLQAGEKISALDLLYGLMLQSGNDCAVALAISVSGSVKDFAALMNKTAQGAGATNSNFVNPHGLHHDEHYTTAYDLAVITAHAMQNPIFKEIVATKSRTIERTRQNSVRVILNKNKLLSSFEGADGVKTGFTKKAGRCLVASATRNGMQVISVVLNCGPMFQDCARLMEAALGEFKPTCVAKSGEEAAKAPIENGKLDHVSAGFVDDIFFPLRANETLSKRCIFAKNLKAPIKKGTQIGQADFTLNGKVVLTTPIYALQDAAALNLGDFLKDILSQW